MNIEEKIDICLKRRRSEMVFKNARLVNVFDFSIQHCDICVEDGEIIALGDYEGQIEVDLEGKTIIPGLVDAHVHIESSMVCPSEFAKALVPRGVMTAICDPHEIANVMGLQGIDYMIKDSEDSILDCRFMLPSCVPCASFEQAGAVLTEEELRKRKDHPRILGLGEVMDFVGVFNKEEQVLEKLKTFSDKIIDGHGPGLSKEQLSAYRAVGILTDHECSSEEELKDRVRQGMYVQIRQGSAARNAEILLNAVNRDNLDRILFCTDDKHPSDLRRYGSVDEICRMALKKGFNLPEVIKMACFNPCQCYGIKNKGAISPGYEASFVVLKEDRSFEVESVYHKGKLVAQNGKMLENREKKGSMPKNSMKIYPYTVSDFKLPLNTNKANVIEIVPNELITHRVIEKVKVEDGVFVCDSTYQKIAIVERHHGLNSMGRGIIKGFDVKGGAICSTIAHDSHNLIIVGDNDKDMMYGMKRVQEIGGGLVIIKDEKIIDEIPLPIAGIMSVEDLETVEKNVERFIRNAHESLHMNPKVDPIITLGFMALPVIPEIKLTTRGLYDVMKGCFIEVSACE